MTYTIRDISERSGLAPRTLRSYSMYGLIPRANGHGLAAKYGDEHMMRAITIGRMRAQGLAIEEIMGETEDWSTATFAQYVAKTDPPAAAVAPAADATPPAAAAAPSLDESALPEAPAGNVYALLPGMSLMVDVDAPEVVRRMASEILAKYGQSRTGRRG